ncbi:MAG TPA: DUF3025 domain-containing protein [Xanthomonadaceae bacterium]
MAKRRFIAPARDAIDPAVFDHPVFAGYRAHRDWFTMPDWPGVDALNARMPLAAHRFVVQDDALPDDGLHYETRIAAGRIATREGNWHDLFNAAVWCRYPALKQAFNARQCAHIAQMGPRDRNRAQYALTQFDEAGVIVRLRDASLLPLWDRHDWRALFLDHADAWRSGDIAIAAVVGHALLEIALVPALFMVGKCLVVGDQYDDVCVDLVAQAVREGRVLNDPLELRPLPLAGIPGWYPGQDAGFYEVAECFQPVRAGRVYPAALDQS